MAILTARDSTSGVGLPLTIIRNPFEYSDPITLPENATLKLFQFNLIAISSESLKKYAWQKTLLNELIYEGKWGVVGERHNFLIPVFMCPDKDTPDFVHEDIIRCSFVHNQHGQFIGDLAFKLILPTVFWTNQFLIEHLDSLNTCIKSISEPLPTTDITEFAAALFDIYNCSRHLIIYYPLSTVIARQNNNFQLHAGIVELIQSVINATQQLMKVGGNLLVNAAIDAIGVAGTIRTECNVNEQFKEHLKYKTVEGLINGGLTWILASSQSSIWTPSLLKTK